MVRAVPVSPSRGAMSVLEATSTSHPAAPSRLSWSLRRLITHPDVLLSLGLFALALAPRILYLLWAPVFIGGDSAQYFQPVDDLINNGRFTLSLKRPPLYSWML